MPPSITVTVLLLLLLLPHNSHRHVHGIEILSSTEWRVVFSCVCHSGSSQSFLPFSPLHLISDSVAYNPVHSSPSARVLQTATFNHRIPTSAVTLFHMESVISSLSWACEQVLFLIVANMLYPKHFAEISQHASPSCDASAFHNNVQCQSVTIRKSRLIGDARELYAKRLLIRSQRGTLCHTAAAIDLVTRSQVLPQIENGPSTSPRSNFYVALR
jgi:hypothetical protein